MLLLGSSAIIFYTLSTISSSALQGINKMRVPVIHSFISLAIHIPLLLILFATTDLGVYALVIGVMTFSGLIFVLNFISLYKYIGYRQEIFKTFIIPLMCSAVMGLVVSLLRICHIINNIADCSALSAPLSDMQGHDACGCHRRASFLKKKRPA